MDVYATMMSKPENERTAFLSDGLHLSRHVSRRCSFKITLSYIVVSAGNKFVWNAVREAIQNGAPELYGDALPFDFPYWATVDPQDLPATFKGRSSCYGEAI